MPRWIRYMLAVVALVVAASELISSFRGGRGDPAIEAAVDKAKVAAEAFDTLAQKAKPGVPRQTDPAAKPLLDDVLDTTPLSRASSIPAADLGPINDWGKAVSKVGSPYMLAGTGIDDIQKAAGDAAANEQMDRNLVTYAPEMGRYLDATFVIGGALATLVSAKSDSSSDNEAAKAKIAGDFTQEIQGGMQVAAMDGLDDAWKLKRLETLKVFADKAATMLKPPQCAGLRDTATSVEQALTNEDLRHALQNVSDALKC